MHATQHFPVMLNEVMEMMAVNENGWYVDGTAGGGGHSTAILERLTDNGRLIAFDKDAAACNRVRQRLTEQNKQGFEVICGSFDNDEIFPLSTNRQKYDGILFDLGLSSDQLNDPTRGFGFSDHHPEKSSPLDMRLDQTQERTAADIVNNYSAEELKHIFKAYGDERFAGRLANAIVKQRVEKLFNNTNDLRDVITKSLRPKGPKATTKTLARNFMALRIEVNDELGCLKRSLVKSLELLKKGGRLVIISFHSGEDQLVKHFFREESHDCLCPPEILHCICNHKAKLKLLTKKPLKPGDNEIANNSRSRSARLRAIERLGA